MLKSFLYFILVAIAHAADVNPHFSPNGPMFGGESIKIEEVPYLAIIGQNLYKPGNMTSMCTGIVISADYVLTTAQCVNKHGKPLLVRVNSTTRDAEAVTDYLYEVSEVVTHESFYVNEHGVPVHDLALLTIRPSPDDPAPIFHSAPLFEESEDVSPGVDALTTGWATLNGPNNETEQLVARTVLTLDTNLCDTAYERVGGVPVGQICAAYPGADGKIGCQGDLGSLLVVKGRVAGLLSWGNGCVKAHYPGLYTSIAYYRDWIERHMWK